LFNECPTRIPRSLDKANGIHTAIRPMDEDDDVEEMIFVEEYLRLLSDLDEQ
jgi:hypothetical protein